MSLTLNVSSEEPDGADLTVHILQADDSVLDVPQTALADATREPVLLYHGDTRVGLVRVSAETHPLEALRIAGADAATLASRVRADHVSLVTSSSEEDELAAMVEGFRLGAYRFSDYRPRDSHVIRELTVAGEGAVRMETALHEALGRADAVCFARDLVNRSPDAKTAPLLAETAREMAETVGLACEVWDLDRIRQERMGGLLAVNRGSVEPPRFVILEHKPGAASADPPIVLIGKAVVFDTGGLSLKPTKGSMDKMKTDMAGGAAVLGAMRAIAEFDLPLHVIGLIPMTDNRPGGDAYVPGDVVTMRSGLRVEVLNTDAEGRMLLADALDYARELEPRLVVDVATLTGAVVIALGDRVSGMMTPEDEGADDRIRTFTDAGRKTGEYVHPLPMHPFYSDSLKTDVADLKNVGGREGGSITAAKFLERFTHNADGKPAYPWVHLDIAGTAFTDSPQPYRPKGGTGFGVRLLLEVLRRLATTR
jgi:leucyl aminopeptidase